MYTVYISIRNLNDGMTQARWYSFYGAINIALNRSATAPDCRLHDAWVSPSVGIWQSACWAMSFDKGTSAAHLKMRLEEIAAEFGQGAIAWAVAPETEFLG